MVRTVSFLSTYKNKCFPKQGTVLLKVVLNPGLGQTRISGVVDLYKGEEGKRLEPTPNRSPVFSTGLIQQSVGKGCEFY